MRRIIGIGTVHDDFFGPDRLERFLGRYRPNSLVVEVSNCTSEGYQKLEELSDLTPEDLKNADLPKTLADLIPDNPNWETVSWFVKSFYFEARVSMEYAKTHDTEYIPVNLNPTIGPTHFERATGTRRPELDYLVLPSSEAAVEVQFSYLQDPNDPLIDPQPEIEANKSLINSIPSTGLTIVVSGLAHLYADHNIHDMLDGQMKRHKLCEID